MAVIGVGNATFWPANQALGQARMQPADGVDSALVARRLLDHLRVAQK